MIWIRNHVLSRSWVYENAKINFRMLISGWNFVLSFLKSVILCEITHLRDRLWPVSELEFVLDTSLCKVFCL
jgi:hypothetical protein